MANYPHNVVPKIPAKKNDDGSFTYSTSFGPLTIKSDPSMQPGTWSLAAPRQPAAVTTRCALCREEIRPIGESDAALSVATEQHHAVCEKRPFQIGDVVEFDNKDQPLWHAKDPRWCRGTVSFVGGDYCSMRVLCGSKQYIVGDHISIVFKTNLRHVRRSAPDLASRINDDASGFVERTGRLPKLAYFVNAGEWTKLRDSTTNHLLPTVAPIQVSSMAMSTAAGVVTVIGDPACPVGSFQRVLACVEAGCGALFLTDDTMTGRCPECVRKSVARTSASLDEHGEIRPGSYVRWWPRGRREEQRHADGTMRDGRFMTIEHIGAPWSSTDGFVGDVVDVQKGGGLAFIDRPTVDPLDVEYDGAKLRDLLMQEFARKCNERPGASFEPFSPAQRAAVSAHWSAQLRAKVKASAEAERNRVRIDLEVEPWE